MSYILDALRRAEAERERGNVPGLHTQPVAAPTAPVPPAVLQPKLLWWAAGLVALLLVGALAGLLLTRPAAHEPVVPAAPDPARDTPVPAPTARAAPSAQSAIAPAQALSVVPVVPVAPAAASRGIAARATFGSAAGAANPAPAIVPWDRLPDDLRRQLPVLAIGGAIWSENAANRMLIVSGQLLHEGESAAPGVTLEQIRPKSAVLIWKDLRYEVSF